MKTQSKVAACGLAVLVALASQGFQKIPGMCQAADRATPTAARKPRVKLANDDVESLLYLANDRLVVIRLHLRVDGKSYAKVWDEMIDRYFRELDTNKDGVLTGAEIELIPTQTEIMRTNAGRGQPSTRRLPTISRSSADSNPRDGKVTRKELKAYLKRIGVRPFSVFTTEGNVQQRLARVYNQSNPNQAGQKLFDRLDTNNDGKLSRAELLAASKSLRKSDLDDDELISAAELQGPQSPYFFAGSVGRRSPGVSSGFLSLSSGMPATQIVRQLIRKYDRQPADGKLTAVELGLSKEEFAPYDADKDGGLDFTETLQFLRRPPANIELVVRLGRRSGGRKVIELVSVGAGLKSQVKQVTALMANLSLKDSQVDIVTANSGGWARDLNRTYDQQFKAADTDNNGYIDRMESRRFAIFANAFDQMDVDHDGKVFKKEMLAYFRRQESLTNSQTVLTISSQGRDLFKILDLDRDGRLSRAELEAAVHRIDSWDTDGDGQIAKAEIPRQYRLSLGRGQIGNGLSGVLVAAPVYGPGGVVRRGMTSGPRWFRRMDLNRDGEVSRREFLGPPALFKKLDRDGNGRIDPREAAAAAVFASESRADAKP
jgi:Ca2+-binding EF-hand superfamily protein